MSNKVKTNPKFHRTTDSGDDGENERQKSNYNKRKSFETGSQDGEECLYGRSTSIYRRTRVMQSDREHLPPVERKGEFDGTKAGKLSEVFCAVCCNKYLYNLQFASYSSSLPSSVYIFLNFLLYILRKSLARGLIPHGICERIMYQLSFFPYRFFNIKIFANFLIL